MDARPVEWSDLEIFLAAARGGTLASAATSLRVDASTVHRRIGKLEAAMRAALFVRSPRGNALTAAGQDLYAHALAMEEQATAALRKVAAHDAEPIGKVRVATVDDMAVHILPGIVSSFRALHPNVTVVVDVRTSFVDLAKHEADIALRMGMAPPSGDIVVKRVVAVNVGLYASRSYLRAHGRPRSAEDLREHAIVRAGEMHARLTMERMLERFGQPGKIAFRSDSFYVRTAAIRAGVGIGFVPYFMASGDKTLVHLPLEFPEVPTGADLLLVVHADLRRNARVRAFVDHAYGALQGMRARFETVQ
jgi:DNA-binding transcriptional LysR family regulator